MFFYLVLLFILLGYSCTNFNKPISNDTLYKNNKNEVPCQCDISKNFYLSIDLISTSGTIIINEKPYMFRVLFYSNGENKNIYIEKIKVGEEEHFELSERKIVDPSFVGLDYYKIFSNCIKWDYSNAIMNVNNKLCKINVFDFDNI